MTRRFLAAVLVVLGVGLIALPLHIKMTGLCLLAVAAVLLLLEWRKGKPHEKTWRTALLSLTALGICIVLGGMGYIALEGRDDVPENDPPEFAVVLGAQIYGDQPSLMLKKRLDKAKDYLESHPQAVVFVAGGQGTDETQPEAAVMEAYLLRLGVGQEHIIKETESHNTRENLINSKKIAASMGMDTDRVLLITSAFHLCRAKYIARTLGLDPCGLGCEAPPKILEVNYLLREVFAFVKAWALA